MPPLTHGRMQKLQNKYSLDKSGNIEIRCSFIEVALKAKWVPIIPAALKFISEIGRGKYLKPIFKYFCFCKLQNYTFMLLGDFYCGKKAVNKPCKLLRRTNPLCIQSR